jgi:hypothetical protein
MSCPGEGSSSLHEAELSAVQGSKEAARVHQFIEAPLLYDLPGAHHHNLVRLSDSGESMSDEEIAAVLTYVRRAWGQTASPVDSASVQQIRAATAGRTRAWTPAELGQIK